MVDFPGLGAALDSSSSSGAERERPKKRREFAELKLTQDSGVLARCAHVTLRKEAA